jgi:hypothetical protein
MKNTILIVLLCCLSISSLLAQPTILAKGPAFEEPEEGFAKILFMKDKRTVFMHLSEDGGIKLKVYDVDHKQILTKFVNVSQLKMKDMDVEGCFEVNQNLALLVSGLKEKTPTLYRVVLDGQTGALVSTEELGKLNKLNMGSAFAMAFGGVKEPGFIVRKDPNSDNYAVASFNTFTSETDRRVEVVHYNNQHKVISKAYLSLPEEKYKYVNILDLAVNGDKEAYALTYGFNTRKSGGRAGELFLAIFKNNQENADFISLYGDEGSASTDGILRYHPASDKLYAVTQVQESERKLIDFSNSSTTYYSINSYVVDVKANKGYAAPPLDLSKVNEKHQELFGKKSHYSGVVQNFYLNQDGSYTYILEGLEKIETQRTSSVMTTTTMNYNLGDIAVVNYNNKGALTSSALIPKSQMINNGMLTGGAGVKGPTPLYHYKRDYSAQQLKGGNQYKSFSYFNGSKKNYVLVNDIEENEERIQKGKITNIKGVGECDAFSFETSSILPSRKFIFGKPDGKRDHNLAIFSISDYDREANIYATLKLEVDGRERKVKVIWLKMD